MKAYVVKDKAGKSLKAFTCKVKAHQYGAYMQAAEVQAVELEIAESKQCCIEYCEGHNFHQNCPATEGT